MTCCRRMCRSGRAEQRMCKEGTYQFIVEPFHLSITGSNTLGSKYHCVNIIQKPIGGLELLVEHSDDCHQRSRSSLLFEGSTSDWSRGSSRMRARSRRWSRVETRRHGGRTIECRQTKVWLLGGLRQTIRQTWNKTLTCHTMQTEDSLDSK